MTQQQAAAFVQMLNQCQPYVPPLIFGRMAETDAAKIVSAIANGQMACAIEPVQPPPQ